MKAITIKQPWASLIVHGIKDIENRTWPCPKKYIGQRVLIHSSAIPVEMINPNSVFTRQQWDSFSLGFQREIICGEGYINSAIIGSVEIIDCVMNHPSIWAEKGVYNWLLANPILFPEPIPVWGIILYVNIAVDAGISKECQFDIPYYTCANLIHRKVLDLFLMACRL